MKLWPFSRTSNVVTYDWYRWHDLASYNAEVAHGIVHTPAYDAKMALQQAEYEAEQDARLLADGFKKTTDGSYWKFG